MNETIYGLIGLIFGSGISFIIFKRQTWGEIVSKNRMEWINNFREEVSKVLLPVELNIQRSNDDSIPNTDETTCSILKDGFYSKNKLLTRLNINHGANIDANQKLAELLDEYSIKNFHNLDDKWGKQVIFLTKMILEPEWRRVKKEAKGVDQK
jgi:hypothetical protein